MRISVVKQRADGSTIEGSALLETGAVSDFRDLDGAPMDLEAGASIAITFTDGQVQLLQNTHPTLTLQAPKVVLSAG